MTLDYSIKRYNKYSDEEFIERLREFAQAKGQSFVSASSFTKATGISESTIANHFDTWRRFCEKAGLSPRYERKVDKIRLFENLDRVWQNLGRQPRAKEMKQPTSPISMTQYNKVFGKNWYDICVEFISWKSGTSVKEIEQETLVRETITPSAFVRKTRREVSLSLRYEVLKRDGFRCVRCGRSPATDQNVQLHIDHVRPWSNGGETILHNLQTLCSECNLGKADKHDG